jgi:hypothetical protein
MASPSSLRERLASLRRMAASIGSGEPERFTPKDPSTCDHTRANCCDDILSVCIHCGTATYHDRKMEFIVWLIESGRMGEGDIPVDRS